MKSSKKILSVVLSCAIALSSAVVAIPISSSAAQTEKPYFSYDNTSYAESKEAVLTEIPFNVFDIYNAYHGIPKTTKATTTTTTTTATTTTTIPTTTTTTVLSYTPTTASMVQPPKYTVTANTSNSGLVTTTVTTDVSTPVLSAPESTIGVITTQTNVETSKEISNITTTSRYGSLGEFYLNGIDVSEHQGEIDWIKVADSDIDYAIIRAGYGKELYQRDARFDENMKAIQQTDLYYGIYWFSYALNVDEALQEAETCYQMIKDYDGYTFPIYFDIETTAQRDALTTAEVSAMTEAFCSYLQEKGYYAGVYSYSSFLQTKLYTSTLEKYDVWVAQYGDKITWYTGDYGMWQYTSIGQVDGINTNVDMNYCYLNYPLLVSPETYTGIVTTYPKTTTTTTTTTTATTKNVNSSSNQEGSSSGGSNNSSTTTTAVPMTTSTTTTTTTAPVFDPFSYATIGISVSSDNGYIDWNNVKSAGYSFGVIRAGSGDDLVSADPLFYVNMENAKSAGIYCGVYWQAKSVTEDGIIKEAEAFYNIIKDYSYEYPIYLDFTDPAITNAGLSKSDYSKLITAFCSYFEGMRYYIGIRANESFLLNSLDSSVFEAYDVYLINSGDKPTFDNKYGIWQNGKQTVSGVLGNTDVAYCYRVYPSVMSYYGLNGCY